MLPERLRYVVIEGPIGVGKTTLARRLSGLTGARLMLEEPGANPFLAKFYADPARHALPTQLFFLFQRVNQLSELHQSDLFSRLTVADFMLQKDPLFAELTLDADELALYRETFRHLGPRAPRPDLVVYLQASAPTLAERVRRRGHDYERPIGIDYLARLAERYARFFHEYSDAPMLVVNTENLDLVEGEDDFALLLQRIRDMKGPREYFNLGA